jgi:xanthine dehydrogenase YagS FAD-binding subunit
MEYVRPVDPLEAARLLAEGASAPLGGGTDLLVTIREGLTSPERVVDLRGLPGFTDIAELPDGALHIGAGVRIADLASHQRIVESFPALAQACEAVGSPALRHMGTLGGNLCQRPRCWYFRSGIPCLKSGGSHCPAVDGENQHLAILGGGPCHAIHPSDPAVALFALNAHVLIMGPAAERSVPVESFYVLPDSDPRRETVDEPREFVASVVLPAAAAGGTQWFSKVLQRGAWDFALASVAVSKRTDGSVRIVLGGVAPTPWRVNPSVEEDVAAGPLSADDLDSLAERALYDARPLSKNGYKVELASALLREAMRIASSS